MGLGSFLFGKKYNNTSSYDYVSPNYDFYEQFAPKLLEQAATAPEVNLDVGSYTPYGKIMDYEDTGKGYNEYTLREVLDPTYNLLGKEFKGKTWETPEFFLRATGQIPGGMDMSSAMLENKGLISSDKLSDLTKQWLKSQNYMTEKENLGDELTGYYTPYEMYAGLHTGQGTDIGFNPAASSVNPNVIFENSGDKKSVGKRHNEVHYFDPNWEAVRRYDLDNAGPLLKASMLNSPTLQDTEGWDWKDNTIYDPNYGYFTTNVGTDTFDYDRNHDKNTSSYRKGGIAGTLGTVLSFIPGLQPIGMALSASNAVVNKNPLGAIMSMLPAIPGVNQAMQSATGGLNQYFADATGQALNSALVKGLSQGVIGAGMGGLSSAIQGGDILKGALSGGLTSGTGAGLSTAIGYDFLPKGSTGSNYVNPAINRALTSVAMSGLFGGDTKTALQNSLLNSAWNFAGREFANSDTGRSISRAVKNF